MQILFGDTRKKEFLQIMKRLHIGRMCITMKPQPYENEKWGFDNGAFAYYLNGLKFNENEYLHRFEQAYNLDCKPYMAVLPDIVAGGEQSLDFSLEWLERLPNDWDWYLAVQDEMSIVSLENILPDNRIKGILLGGTNKFKGNLGLVFKKLSEQYNKKFHFGRAGTLRRIQFALELGCDSLDSSFPLWTQERFNTITELVKNNFKFNQTQLFN